MCGSGVYSEAGDGGNCEKKKCVYFAFIDMEKDRRAMWQMLQMYAGDGVLRWAVKSFYEKSKTRVRVCGEEGMSFKVTVRLRQECLMSLWLFNFLWMVL